jgi:hypothetical protein
MSVTVEDIAAYLADVSEAVGSDRFRIELNDNRQDNRQLFFDYILSESDAKKILLGLDPMDFSEIKNNDNPKFPNERLYVFGKEVMLTERFGYGENPVSLYIKINKLQNNYVIVVSFHEGKYPIKYYFK